MKRTFYWPCWGVFTIETTSIETASMWSSKFATWPWSIVSMGWSINVSTSSPTDHVKSPRPKISIASITWLIKSRPGFLNTNPNVNQCKRNAMNSFWNISKSWTIVLKWCLVSCFSYNLNPWVCSSTLTCKGVFVASTLTATCFCTSCNDGSNSTSSNIIYTRTMKRTLNSSLTRYHSLRNFWGLWTSQISPQTSWITFWITRSLLSIYGLGTKNGTSVPYRIISLTISITDRLKTRPSHC